MKIYMGKGKKYFYLFNLFFALCALFCTSFTSETESELGCFFGVFFPYFSFDAAAFLHCSAAEECSSSRQFLGETLKQFQCWVCDT